jgi:signal transduction histidine kinase
LSAVRKVAVLAALAFIVAAGTGQAAPSSAPSAPPAAAPFSEFGARHHTLWTRRDGAPGQVTALAQDGDGNLWLGSPSGLTRFDGDTFETIDSLGTGKLPPTGIAALAFIDGALWLGYGGGGAAVLRQGRLTAFGSAAGLPPAAVTAFARDAGGATWVKAGDGSYRFDGARFERWRDGAGLAAPPAALSAPPPAPPADRATFTGAQGMSGATVLAALTDREGNRWYGTSGGLDRIRPNRMRRLRLPPGQRPTGVLAAAGAVLVGTVGDDAGGAGVLHLAAAGPSMPGAGAGMDRTVARGPSAGALGAAMPAAGTAPAQALPDGAPAGASTRDPAGALWLAQPDRLVKYPGAGGSARRAAPAQAWSWPADWSGADVRALAVAADGRPWAAVAGKGSWTLDPATASWRRAAGLPDATPTALAAGATALWLGYADGRVAMLGEGAPRLFGAADGLPAGGIASLLPRGAGVWTGGSGGLGLIAAGRATTIRVRAQVLAAGAGLHRVAGLAGADGGDVWALDENGLHRILAADADAGQGALKTAASSAIDVAGELFNEEDGMDGAAAAGGALPALARAEDGRIWYATGSAVGWIDPAHLPRNDVAPVVSIRSVGSDAASYPLTGDALILPQGTRNAQIAFTATALAIPERVSFRYRLRGVDAGWRDPGHQRSAFYTGLGPGAYRFEVIAANEDGVWSARAASLRLRILPAWYQTPWCRGLAGAGAALLLYALYCWRVRLLTRRVGEGLRARMDERERIARTLHDTLLQGVQALALRCQTAINRLEREAPARVMIERALDDADRLMEEARDALSGLRAQASCADDLRRLLEDDAAALGQGSSAVFSLAVEGVPRPMKSLARQEIHGIAREALANAFRHAAASRIEVLLDYGEERFTATVRDDGVGIAAALAEAGRRGGHWGLPGMRERASSLGGTLAFGGGEGGGVTVTLNVPARRAYRAIEDGSG